MSVAVQKENFVKPVAFVVSLGLAAIGLGGCRTHQEPQSAVQRGRAIAETWCTECHRIAPDQPSGARPGHILPPRLVAPSFMDVADRPGTNRESLQRFTTELHLPMPTFRLAPDEREDVISYILSLKQ